MRAASAIETNAAHLKRRRPVNSIQHKPTPAESPMQIQRIVRSPHASDDPHLQRPALQTQASRSFAARLWPLAGIRCWVAALRVGQIVAGAEGPGGPEAVDGDEKAVTAAAGEDGEGGDQLVVARDERRTVV